MRPDDCRPDDGYVCAVDGFDMSGTGSSVSLVQPLTPSLAASFGYDLGTALTSDAERSYADRERLGKGIAPRMTYAASGSLRGKILRTGTTMRAEYRWQPERYADAGERVQRARTRMLIWGFIFGSGCGAGTYCRTASMP